MQHHQRGQQGPENVVGGEILCDSEEGVDRLSSVKADIAQTYLVYLVKYWARNYYLSWVALKWVNNLRFVHPQKAGERYFSPSFTQPITSNNFGPSIRFGNS